MKIIEYFENLETTTEYNGYYYNVGEAVSIIIMGLLCGLENVSQIHQWATSEKVSIFLDERFGISRIPCYYWLLCLLKMIKPESMNKCFTEWVSSMLPDNRDGIAISLDGKTIRSTVKDGSRKDPLHIVSAQIAGTGMTLSQKTVDHKSNEIPAVQELLEEMDIAGCMIVADALNCQKKTAEAVIRGGADYMLDAKDNQKNLKREIQEYVKDDELRKEMDSAEILEKNRERTEKRTAYCTNDIGWMTYGKQWESISCIGAVRLQVESEKGTSDEWHYYISSRKLTAEEMLKYARCEWSVETMHWLLDVHFREDYCRILNGDVQQNLNMLRKTALNMVKRFKQNKKSKLALSKIMFNCLLDTNALLDILSEN